MGREREEEEGYMPNRQNHIRINIQGSARKQQNSTRKTRFGPNDDETRVPCDRMRVVVLAGFVQQGGRSTRTRVMMEWGWGTENEWSSIPGERHGGSGNQRNT